MRPLAFILFLITALIGYSQNTEERLAFQFYENHEFEKAEKIFKRLYKQRASSSYCYEYYLSTLIALNKQHDAEKLIVQQIKKKPSNLQYLVDLGYVYDQFGEKEKTSRLFEKTIKSNDNSVYETRNLANYFKRRGYLDFAISTYESGIKKFGNNELYRELVYAYRSGLRIEKLADFSVALVVDLPKTYPFVIQNLDVVFENTKATTQLQKKVLQQLQKKPSNTALNDLLLECYTQSRNYALALQLVKSIDKRLSLSGDRVVRFAQTCIRNKAYEQAVKAFSYVVSLGRDTKNYITGQNGWIDALYLQTTQRIKTDSEEISILTEQIRGFIAQEGINYKTAHSIRRLAELNLFYLNKTDVAVSLLNTLIKTPRLQTSFTAQNKLLLGDAYLILGNVWEARLMYGQVEKQFKEDALGQEARFKNAKLSYYTGDFEWAKNQLDVLKTATTQLISNNALELSLLIQDNTGLDSTSEAMKLYASAEFYLYQNKADECLGILNMLPFQYPNHSLNDEIYYLKARVQEKLGNFKSALSYYQSIYQKFGSDILADNALYRSAIITLDVNNDKEKALLLFEKLILEHNTSLYANDARKHYFDLKKNLIDNET